MAEAGAQYIVTKPNDEGARQSVDAATQRAIYAIKRARLEHDRVGEELRLAEQALTGSSG